MGVRSGAVAVLAISSLVLVLGYAAAWWPGGAPRWIAVAFAVSAVTQIGAFCVLGAVRRDGAVGVVWIGVITMVLCVGGALVVAVLAPDPGAAEPLLLGLPRRTGLVMYGVGLAPLLALATVFVRSFDEWAPTDADVARLRAIRDGHGPDACD